MADARTTIDNVADLGTILHDRRREMRLRLEDVARISGVSRQMVSQMEKGGTSSTDKLLAVLHVLQIRVELHRGVPRHVEIPPDPPKPARTRTQPAVDPDAMYETPDRVRCLDCGAAVRMLGHHVRQQHGIGLAAYRQRWNLDPNESLVPRELQP